MNRHLSSQQISEYLIGAGAPGEVWHARECATCRHEIECLERPLAWFRASVHHWGDRQCSTSAFELTPVLLLTPESLDQSWYRGILAAIREAIDSPELPPLDVTSKPIEVPRLWGFFGGHEKTAGAYSVLIHCAVLAILFVLGSMQPVQRFVRQTTTLIMPDIRPYLAAPKKAASGGGGGGGARMALDASKGKLPKPMPKQFTPPTATPPPDPKLIVPASIVAPDDIPNIVANNMGDPLSKLGIPSNGTGLGGGIGNGIGTGVGPGNGAGFGPGSGGGFAGGAYRIGGAVSAPTILSKVEPEYSEEARKAKWQGTVVLSLVVDAQGRPQGLKVARSLGLGLDQKAMEAVAKWRFRPGMKDGKPVPVIATIEVNFRLL
jgi:protein TonB